MDALEALQNRVSVAVLSDPGPDKEQLQHLLKAAIRAPDHGVLRPWRFIVLEGEDRGRLGQLLCKAKAAEQPEISAEELHKLSGKPFRAPMILAVVAEITPEHRISPLEQIVATGAAVQNMMVAAHALGLGAMWRTGGLANHRIVKQGLGFQEKDELVGFVYLGTPAGSIKRVPVEQPEQFIRALPKDDA